MFCNYQLIIVGIVLLCIGYLVIYGSSSTSIKETFVGEADAAASCKLACENFGYCCNDIMEGSNQYLSCAQGCYMAKAEAADRAGGTINDVGPSEVSTCKSKCKAQGAARGCSYQDSDVHFPALCGVCSDFVPNAPGSNASDNPKCAFSGAGSGESCAAGCDLAVPLCIDAPGECPDWSTGWMPYTPCKHGTKKEDCPKCCAYPSCGYNTYSREEGEIPYKCKTPGWVLKPSPADNSNGPICPPSGPCDDSICCEPPTCSTFLGAGNCPVGTSAKSANDVCNSSAGGAVDPWKCSNAPSGSTNPGTCWGDSAYQCAGQGAYNQIQALPTAGTSGGGGSPYSDGGQQAYELYMKLCNISSCNSNTCCTPNPQCSSLGGCPEKTTMKSSSQVCEGPVCSTNECCPPNPVCTSSICNAQTQIFTGSNVICNEETCTAGECCADRAQCSSITCDPAKYDSKPGSTYCAGTTCGVSECCIPDPTCYGYNCPGGTYHPKPNLAGIKCGVDQSCTTDDCCNLNPTCAGFSPCPIDEHLKKTAPNIRCKTAECTSAECCGWNPKCSTQTCPEDDFYWSYAHIPNASSVFCNTEVCTEKQCCVATPTGNLPKVQTYPLMSQ